MNTGIFGEGFPYSNFHDLNMDWIIKIAKDFLDQYTHIQETIENGLNDLDEKAETLQALLQEWYDTHSEDIANQLADALEDLNDWYTTHQNYLDATLEQNIQTFDNHAEQKAQETIATIPSDYTTLSNTVQDHSDALGDSMNIFNPDIPSERIGKYFAQDGYTTNSSYNVGYDFYLLPNESIYFWIATDNGVEQYTPRFMYTGQTTDALTNDASGGSEYVNWLDVPQYVRFTISVNDWDSVIITHGSTAPDHYYPYSLSFLGNKVEEEIRTRSKISSLLNEEINPYLKHVITHSPNIIDKNASDVRYGYYYTGGAYTANSNYITTGQIEIPPHSTIYFCKNGELYTPRFITTGSKNNVGDARGTRQSQNNPNDEPLYCIVSIERPDWDDVMGVLTSDLPSTYSPYGWKDAVDNPRFLNPVTTTKREEKYISVEGELISYTYFDTYEFTANENTWYKIRTFDHWLRPADRCLIVFVDSNDNVLYRSTDSEKFDGYAPEGTVKGYVSCNRPEYNIPFITYVSTTPNRIFEQNCIRRQNLTDYETGVSFGIYSYIRKNAVITVSGVVGANFTKLQIRRGNGQYTHGFVYITQTGIKLNDVASDTYPHGLTIQNWLTVTIESAEDNHAIITLATDGGKFVFDREDVTFYAQGVVDVFSDDFYLAKAEITYNDLNRDVRVYGDSYVSTDSMARWPLHASKQGARFLVNGLPGGHANQLFPQMINDMYYSIPKIIVWSLGMNDGVGDVGEWWYAVKDICEMLNVEMIACTVPVVPSYNHNTKNATIRASGLRYIDFDNAVSNGVDNTWISGMLSQDNVHPTVFGAYALAQEALATIPELMP